MNRCSLAHRLWLLSHRRSAARFGNALAAPRKTQQQLLQTILRRNQQTLYGKRHRFESINDFAEYRRRVPRGSYEDLEEDIQRIRRGEQHVLTADRVTRLVPTSGTTKAAKLIPYTAGLQRQFNAAIGPWITDLYREHPSLMLGPSYWSISPAIGFPQEIDDKVPIGFDNDTAYLGRYGQWLVDATLAVPGTVRHLPDFEDFRYATLWWLLGNEQLRLVSVWHPSFWSLLMEALPKWWHALTDDLARGVCRLPSGLHMNTGRYRPKRDLHHLRPSDWRSIWPRLSVISAWGDAAARQPFASLGRAWPHVKLQPKGILSTESFLSLPWRGQYPAAVTSHVIELIGEDGACIGIDAAEVGGVYEPLITTAGGLYRYRTGDRVQVTGRYEQTPTLCLLGRIDQTHDICGEKLSEAHVRDALEQIFRKLDIQPTFVMMAAAEPQAPTGYELFLATEAERDLTPLDGVRDELEARLHENPHYAYARRLGQLRPLTVHQVGKDAHSRFLMRMSESGTPAGGVKPALISNLSGWYAWFA